MRLPLMAAALFGFLLAATLIAWYGFAPVLGAAETVGWGAVLVPLVRAVQIAAAGLAWWFVVPGATGRLVKVCVLLRWVRESINNFLQVGGEFIGARLLTFWDVPGGTAGASVVSDLFVQTATQFVFTLVGLAVAMRAGGSAAIVRAVAIGLAILGPALIGFFVAQRHGGFRMVERALLRLAQDPKWAVLGGVATLHERLQDIYGDRKRLAVGVVIHFVIWFFGVCEVWIALHFMGYPVDYSAALVIESLGQAVRGAAFMIPGAIGVQEGGFIAVCAVFGIPAPTAIALSLVKRLPDIVLGLPGLLIWQGLEGRRLLATRTKNDMPPARAHSGQSPGP